MAEGFTASSTAWLNTVWQNWCTYGPSYPQKDTIIFTTLTRGALPNRHCKHHCKDPKIDGKHENSVYDTNDSYESGQWPQEFVGAVLKACVGHHPYAGL